MGLNPLDQRQRQALRDCYPDLMETWQQSIARNRAYLGISAFAIGSAILFSLLDDIGPVPVLGHIPVLATTVFAAVGGGLLLAFLQRRANGILRDTPQNRHNAAKLVALGFFLSIPPVLIDIFTRFPRDINLLLPHSLVFYPAIALIAETTFHLAPLAICVGLTGRGITSPWVFVPAIIAEPVFQAAYSSGGGLQAWLVLGNVGLISAVQIWLFATYGFGAMFALRLVFYLFWHVLWGTVRLALLF